MEGENENEGSYSFPMGQTSQERGFPYVPQCYKVPIQHRPSLNNPENANVPLIDLNGFDNPARRSIIVRDIAIACRTHGFFQIINHGISEAILDGALSAAFEFFDLPTQEKLKFMSNDVHKPVRYGTSLKNGEEDKLQFWRIFLKHYAHPLKEWIHLWPINPPHYREKMGQYAAEVHKLSKNIMAAITEGLGLGPTYLNTTKLDNNNNNDEVQVIAVNCYPPCPQPNLALGLPPHSDYSCLTILHQTSSGLEIIDHDDDDDDDDDDDSDARTWKSVPYVKGALQVQVGDHLEVLSNGVNKSVVHRATLNSEKMRISIASFHSLGMDVKMETAEEFVDDEHPKGYKESSFRDFLDFLSHNDIADGTTFLQTLKINGN